MVVCAVWGRVVAVRICPSRQGWKKNRTMKDEKIVKEAYDFAQKEINEERERKIREEVKKIVKSTLEKIETLNEKKKELEKEIKILKQDLDNLKEGRLDLILERQQVDKDAKKVSVINIIEIVNVPPTPTSPWKRPYDVWCDMEKSLNWCDEPRPLKATLSCNTVCTQPLNVAVTGQMVSGMVQGTYKLDNGITKFIN